jgi:hypothetical protein
MGTNGVYLRKCQNRGKVRRRGYGRKRRKFR